MLELIIMIIGNANIRPIVISIDGKNEIRDKHQVNSRRKANNTRNKIGGYGKYEKSEANFE